MYIFSFKFSFKDTYLLYYEHYFLPLNIDILKNRY